MHRSPLPSEGDARDLLRWALASTSDGQLRVVTLPVPSAPLSVFLSAVERDPSFLWHPPFSTACAGSGATARIALEGAGRLTRLREWRDALFARTHHYVSSSDDAPIRVFGGFSFHPGGARHRPWTGFGDGEFVLPRWTYTRDGERARLTVALDGEVAGPTVLNELDDIVRALESARGQASIAPYSALPASCVEQPPFAVWERLVNDAKTAIASGAFAKLVATSRCEVALRRPLDDVAVITRLVAEPSCTRFAFRRENASFVGASPETLFVKRGRVVRTEALAGTIRSLGSEPPILRAQKTKLLESDKDAIEHDYVVREIERTLSKIATGIRRPPAPEIRKIRNIMHLATPFEATLIEHTTALDVIAALHPTPAVGGLPREGAADWLAAHEQHERGWYTGPVGWLDAVDDAEFVIAIRSGVLTPERAYVMTGAGIVAASDVQSELAEIQLKQLPLLRAIGVSAL